ncbi:MAG: MFS transporter, partial [Acidobacteriaceae bacterium]
VLFTTVNFLLTIVGMMLVDRRGRRFLLVLGTSGVMISLIATALLFRQTERNNLEVGPAVATLVTAGNQLTLKFDASEASNLLSASGHSDDSQLAAHASLAVIYSYGDFTGATTYVRSDDPAALPIHITRQNSLPANAIEAFFKNPLANLNAARTAPLRIERARIGVIPSAAHGRLVALLLFVFIAFYASGPGVCVWLALSELMPTRIRSVGMSIALVLNQLVSTMLAVVFLPVVSKYGYASMFFLFAAFTLIYLITAAFFLPETKGKTLEEIELHFES